MKDIDKRMIQYGVSCALNEYDDRYISAVEDGFEKMKGFIYSLIGSGNAVASIYTAEVIDILEEKGLLKFQIKKFANNSMEVYNEYHRIAVEKLNENVSERSTEGNRAALWDNINAQLYSLLEDDIANFEKEIEGKLQRFYKQVSKMNAAMAKVVGKIDMPLYAKLYTARILIETSTQRCEKIFKILSEEYTHGYNMQKHYPEFHLQGMVTWWLKLMDLIVGKNICPPFNQDAKCKKAFKVIDDKLNDIKTMNDAALVALGYDHCFDNYVENLKANNII